MPLPLSGPISIDQIRTELGVSISDLRTLSSLIGRSTPDSMDEFYGAINVAVGDFALGGVVFYILQPGDPGYDAGVQHGLVLTSNYDTLDDYTWGCTGIDVTGTSSALGAGKANTDLIIAACGNSPSYAAGYCYNLVEGGYSDWYLPSGGEMLKLYENRSSIPGYDAYPPTWTSVQYSYNIAYGYQSGGEYIGSKADRSRALPIRSF